VPTKVILAIAKTSDAAVVYEFQGNAMFLNIRWAKSFMKTLHKNPLRYDKTSLFRLIAAAHFVYEHWDKLIVLCTNIDQAKDVLLQLFLKGWAERRPVRRTLPAQSRLSVKSRVMGTPVLLIYAHNAFEVIGAEAVEVARKLLIHSQCRIRQKDDVVYLHTHAEVFGSLWPVRVVLAKSIWDVMLEWAL